jgi:enamine deaminase RidA (YjgF/YER057c/UK114 family)
MGIVTPEGWPAARGYAHGISATGRVVCVSGQIGWNTDLVVESDDFVEQARKALTNVVAVLAAAGAGPEHIVRMTWYVVDMDQYLARSRDLGVAYRDVIGRHYPAMSVIGVQRLVHARAKLEIEATAVVDDGMLERHAGVAR